MSNKILFITLSNIGDVILTLPVLDTIRKNFPQGKITVITGERPKKIFEHHPDIHKVIVINKRASLKEKIRLFNDLKEENFDMVIDLRNSFLGFMLKARHKTSPFGVVPKRIKHMRERHLYKLQGAIRGYKMLPGIIKGYKGLQEVTDRVSLRITEQDEEYIENILKINKITGQDKIIIIAPGARSHIKRWPEDKFVALIPKLINEFKVKIILVGDKDDAAVCEYISKKPVINLCEKTTISQLACLLKKSRLLISNDSAVMHLAGYLNIPVVAIFGPTDESKYGPWSEGSAIVKKDIWCRPCEKARCRLKTLACMALIKEDDVLKKVRDILVARSPLRPGSGQAGHQVTNQKSSFKRILIVRTDKIGDVLLSTSVIKALRDNYPTANIAVMVSPYAKEIVSGNPYLDEVIIYDKDGKHKSWIKSLDFAGYLKKKNFDLAMILHPTNRAHLVTFLAGIKKRVGYNRKLGFLLTDKIEHTKQKGEKHESEYVLDLVRYLGIEPADAKPFMPISSTSEKWVEELLISEGISRKDKLLGIHPAASCPSRIWPQDRFAQVADKLIEIYGFKVLVFAAPKDIKLAEAVIKEMKNKVINLAGKTSVSQLASLLKRCSLFISNDSGPAHIASAVGVPVISIFGRNQKGLSPKRWGPLGLKNIVLHKEAGCIECLAHNCTKEFACLKAITVDDVLNAAKTILADAESLCPQ